MQKMLLILIAFFSASSAFSQINKGQFLVGGSGSFSGRDENSVKSTKLTVSPNAGYFFMDKLAGGLNLVFDHGRTKLSIDQKTSGTSYGISPFVRYYVLPASNKINLFAQASYGWGRGTMSSNYSEGKYKVNTNYFSFSAGPAFFINRNVAIELTAGYTQTDLKSKYDGSTSTSKNKNFQAGVGFQIHLGKERK
ncbi:MAG: porin family protein [Chitinophagaceae bacterium]|nr:porin family protein [Chitinophagaceae bacterium]